MDHDATSAARPDDTLTEPDGGALPWTDSPLAVAVRGNPKLRVLVCTETYRAQRELDPSEIHQLASVLDSYNAQSSNALNQVMRLLTSYSIILTSITFVAGVYGMNFNTNVSPFNMRELNLYFGYPVALVLMGGLGITIAFYFRRRGWM